MKKLGMVLVSAAVFLAPAVSLAANLSNLNGLTTATQTFATSTAPNSPHLLIQSSGSVHTFKWDSTPWLLNQGGTGATSFATGSIPFINNGVFSQNNLQLFWDAVNNIFNVGGTTTPSSKVSIKGSGGLGLLNIASSTGTSLFYISPSGTTTIANGVNITGGCYAVNGVCTTSGSGTVSTGTAGQVAYYPFTGASVFGTSTLFFDPSGRIGINNTNPLSAFDVAGTIYSRLVTASGSNIDWNAGNVQSLTLTSSPTLVFSNPHAGAEYKLVLVQDGTGGRTVTWPASVKWPSGTAPTLSSPANSTDVISFVYDGTNYLGSFYLNYQTAGAPATYTLASTSVWDTAGTYTWTAPANTTKIEIVCFGAGGGGSAGNSSESGGGAGAYIASTTITSGAISGNTTLIVAQGGFGGTTSAGGAGGTGYAAGGSGNVVSSNGAGGGGGSSAFGTYCIASGGAGATDNGGAISASGSSGGSSTSGGSTRAGGGGSATGGNNGSSGGAGGTGGSTQTGTNGSCSAQGGASGAGASGNGNNCGGNGANGSGGAAGGTDSQNGTNGSGFDSGGGGGPSAAGTAGNGGIPSAGGGGSTTGGPAGNGGNGRIIIYTFISP